jgi:uncharacterized membrane protein
MFAMVVLFQIIRLWVSEIRAEALTSFKNAYNMSDNKINQTMSNKKMLKTVVTRIQNDVKNSNIIILK